MRYTTIIDISSMRELYKNIHCRLVYLHLVLKSGYHDDDRDLVKYSVRNLAADVSISVAACRHALKVLTKATLVYRKDGIWHVRKFIIDQPPTPRAKTAKQAQEKAVARQREEEQERKQRELQLARENRNRLFQQGKTSWMVFYEKKAELADHGDMEAAAYCKKYEAQYLKQIEEIKKQKQQ